MQTNYIGVKTAISNIYQYHVSFDPHVDARNIRFSLMKQNKEKIGKVMAFDGVILYLPVKLVDPVTVLTGLRKTDNATITIKVGIWLLGTLKQSEKASFVVFIMLKIRLNMQHCCTVALQQST